MVLVEMMAEKVYWVRDRGDLGEILVLIYPEMFGSLHQQKKVGMVKS